MIPCKQVAAGLFAFFGDTGQVWANLYAESGRVVGCVEYDRSRNELRIVIDDY